jgi:hypothetical protein
VTDSRAPTPDKGPQSPSGIPILAASVVSFVVFLVAAPPWPDDWDGLGFLASIHRFDLDAFAPHPPGYPVYVALLKVASLVTPSPMAAAEAVAALSGAATVALLAGAFRRFSGASGSVSALVGLAGVATPLGFHAVSVVGSEAPALALASLALYGLARARPTSSGSPSFSRIDAAIVGAAVGLELGVRLSWAPLVLSLLLLVPRRGRAIAGLTALATALAWAVPFVLLVGSRHLAHLLEVHLSGHATRWGGTALTEPARARFLARDLFVDGLGVDGDFLGVAIGVALLCASILALAAWRNARWRLWPSLALTCGPYLAWVTLGQNLHEQPRHVLPLVTFLALALAGSARVDRRARWATLVLFTLVAFRTGTDALARYRIPPAGAALVAYVRSLPDADQVLVFGVSSIRFFEETELLADTRGAETMGDVAMSLARARKLPDRAFVTSEVSEEHRPSVEKHVATFCRPPRLDRKRPCLDLFEVDPAALRTY